MIIQHLMDTVWLIAAHVCFFLIRFFFCCVFALTNATRGGFTFKQEKKGKQSLFKFHTEIKLSDWLGKTFALFFILLFFLFFSNSSQKIHQNC